MKTCVREGHRAAGQGRRELGRRGAGASSRDGKGECVWPCGKGELELSDYPEQ